jgi:Flp pilus assembly protein TadG
VIPRWRIQWLRRSDPGKETGALTLSYVLIVPVFLVGLMAIVQASVWYLANETMLAAARHGADVARTAQTPPGSGAQAAVQFAHSAIPGFITNVSATTRGSSATMVKMAVSGQITSFVPGWKIHVREVVTAPVEKFVALGASSAGTGPSGISLMPVSRAGRQP